MKQLMFNEINLISGGSNPNCYFEKEYNRYEDCSVSATEFNGRLGLGIGIAAGALGLMVTLFTSCCGGRYQAIDRIENAIEGTACCFPRYTSRIMFSGFAGAVGSFGLGCVGLVVGALGAGLFGFELQSICVPCTP